MAPFRDRRYSETSPLLGPEQGSQVPKIADDVVDDDILAYGTIESEPAADDSTGRRESIDPERAAQFAGNPEARKLLKYIIPAVSIGVFLASADQTIIVSSYGRITSDLQALNLTSWIGTSYFITLSAFQPLYGKLSDIFGRKTCLLIAYAIFGVAGLLCGLSQNIGQLIGARLLQGVGGGGMSTVVSILLSDIVPLKERGLWQGLINIVWAAGSATGAPVGGLLADSIGWRWAFLAQAPICLAAAIAAYYAIRMPQPDQSDWRKKLQRIDFSGAFVLLCAVSGLIFGLDRGSNVAWSRPIAYAPLLASLAFFALFLYIEMRIATEPFAPGRIILKRAMLAPYLCNFFSMGAWLAAVFYIPLFYQAVDGFSATGAAIRLLPAIIASVCGSLSGGIYMKRTGRYYWLTIIAYAMLPIGMVVILLFSGVISNNTYLISVGMIIAAFGNGIGVTSSLMALISNAAPEDQAVATACSYLFRSLGSVAGISLASSVIQQTLRNALKEALKDGKDAKAIERGVRSSLEYIKTLKDPRIRMLVRDCYGQAVRHGYILLVIIAVGSTISSCFLREKRLSR